MPDKPVPPPPAEAVGLTPFYPAKGPQSGAASPHVLGPLGTFQKFPEHIPVITAKPNPNPNPNPTLVLPPPLTLTLTLTLTLILTPTLTRTTTRRR